MSTMRKRWIVLSSRGWQPDRRRPISIGETRGPWCERVEDNAFHLVERLSWRSFAVGKNFGNYRRKFINARAGHDDAVAAAVSFLCDTQEPAALIFPELDIKVLALNLQFFRLDDVVHFALRARV